MPKHPGVTKVSMIRKWTQSLFHLCTTLETLSRSWAIWPVCSRWHLQLGASQSRSLNDIPINRDVEWFLLWRFVIGGWICSRAVVVISPDFPVNYVTALQASGRPEGTRRQHERSRARAGELLVKPRRTQKRSHDWTCRLIWSVFTIYLVVYNKGTQSVRELGGFFFFLNVFLKSLTILRLKRSV